MNRLQLCSVLLTTLTTSCNGNGSPQCPVADCTACPFNQPSAHFQPSHNFPGRTQYQPSLDSPINQACTVCADSSFTRRTIPNIEAAMGGFDPILSNPNMSPDPGFRGKIFDQDTELESGRITLSPFITKLWNNRHCMPKFSKTTLKNYIEYQRLKISYFSSGEFSDITVAPEKSSYGFLMQIDDEELKVRQFFQDTNGEIVVGIYECTTHAIEIASYVTPTFTSSFIEALKSLQHAAIEPNSNSSRDAYVQFTKTFGTHYMKETQLGARLSFERRFARKSKSSEEEERRKDCVLSAARATVTGTKLFYGSGEILFSSELSHCNISFDDGHHFNQKGLQSEKISSVGSLPSNDPETGVINIIDPAPISIDLEPLSTLFDGLHFNFVPVHSSDSANDYFNGSMISNFFTKMWPQHCHLRLGRGCTANTTDGGLDSMDEGQDCRKEASNYEDHHRHRYGEIIVVGGADNQRFLSSSEVLASRRIPSLPVEIWAPSLTSVRDTLYACGGRTRAARVTDRCYTLNLLDSEPVWTEAAFRLPIEMAWHETVALGDNIWFFNVTQLHSLDTKTNLFQSFSLPFTRTRCTVANATHTYAISGGNEVWVNKEESNPAEWQRVATLPIARHWPSCLWLEKNTILITGGGGSPGPVSRSVQILNTDSNSITEVADMLQPRGGHRMMLLDGKPAVIGGYYRDAQGKYPKYKSAETYNMAADQWEPHSITLSGERDGFGLIQLSGL